MKKYVILTSCFLATLAILKTTTGIKFPVPIYHIQQDSLADYTGKYKLSRDTSLYVVIKIEKGALVALQSWDHSTQGFNHLNGDNFILTGLGWSVQFIRGDDKKVNKIIVRAINIWNRSNY